MPAKRYVKHVKRPEWGFGLVLREQSGKLEVRFEHAGDKSLVPNPALIEEVDAKSIPKDSPLKKKPEKKAKLTPLVDDPLYEENHDVVLRAVSLLLRDRLRRAFPPGDPDDEVEDEDAIVAGTAVSRWVEDLSAFVGVPYWRVKKASFKDAKRLAERAGGRKLSASLVARLSSTDRAAETSMLVTRADAIELATTVIAALATARDDLGEEERATLDEAIPWDAIRAARSRYRADAAERDEGW